MNIVNFNQSFCVLLLSNFCNIYGQPKNKTILLAGTNMWKTEKHFDLVEFDDSELCVKSRLVNKEREFAVFPIDKRRLFLSITEIRQIYTYLKEHLIEFTTEDQHLFDITSELLREIKSLRLKAPLKREGITQVTDEVFGH